MTSVPDFTNPEGTQRPNKAPIKAINQNFEPLQMPIRQSKVNLPANINPIDLFALFSLFLTPDIIQIIIKLTNEAARLYYKSEKMQRFDQSKPWYPLNNIKIQRFFGIHIFMGVHQLEN